MRYEMGHEMNDLKKKKENGEKLNGLDAYEDFNNETVPELLEKRKKEDEAFDRRKKERIEKLEKIEKDGKLFIKE